MYNIIDVGFIFESNQVDIHEKLMMFDSMCFWTWAVIVFDLVKFIHHFLVDIQAPPVIVFSSACAGLAG